MAVLVQKFKARAAALPTFDVPFLIILLALLSYGLIMLFSAGYAVALYRRGDAYTYIRPQLLFAALGVAAMYAASLVDYHIWHKLAWPMLGLSLVLLTVVLFMPEYNGCKRWIVLPGLGTLQPSEIAKFSVVLVFSHIISLNHDRMKTFSTGVLPFALILGTVTVLMLLEPHLSGTLLILSIGAVLMFVGGPGCSGSAWQGAWAWRPSRRRWRPCRSWSPTPPTAWPAGGIHSPTHWGRGTRRSRACTPSRPAGWPAGAGQQPPEIFVRTRAAERFHLLDPVRGVGLFWRGTGGSAVLLLLLRGMSIAVRARDKFGALLTVGFVVQVILQAILNIAVVTNTIPNTGISLPFFSSGGTSLLMLLEKWALCCPYPGRRIWCHSFFTVPRLKPGDFCFIIK